jgi:hypothetical protein
MINGKNIVKIKIAQFNTLKDIKLSPNNDIQPLPMSKVRIIIGEEV